MLDFDFDVQSIVSHLTLLGIAFLLALPLGWDRERHARSAGLRTFPLVALASCGFMLVGIDVLESRDGQARILSSLISGMGFIGGGAILKGPGGVAGTATATSLWTTGAIGVSVAWQRFEIACLLSLSAFLVLFLLPAVKPMVRGDEECEEDGEASESGDP